jgi:polynucleotide 5'-hydroxyl-kinase GRC3/NOL9
MLDQILASGGTVLVLGGPDTGKTYTARRLLERAIDAGARVALVDADPGQVEVGLPFCVGTTIMPDSRQDHHTPTAMAFVGGISPINYIPEHLTAIRHIVDFARDTRLVIVDMPGFVHGVGARRLHQLIAELLLPRHVIAISRGSELNSILAPMMRRSGLTVHAVQAAADITPRPAAFREQRRAMRLAAYFDDAKVCSFTFDSVALSGTWLGGGAPIAPHLFTYLTTALSGYTRVYYAEQYGAHLGLMVSKPVSEACPALGIALEQFRAKEVTVSRAPLLKNLVVGLESENGKLLGLGRITAIDFKRRSIGITTPVRAPSAVQIIKLGGIRISDDGSQLGFVRPGEL